MAAPPTEPRPAKRRLLLSVYLVGLAQLAVAAIAIVVTQRVLEKAPWQSLQVRQKAVLDGFAEFWDSPEALGRALAKLEDMDLTFYRLDGSLVASTRPALAPLDAAQLSRLRAASMIFVPYHGPLPITAVPVTRSGGLVGYGLVHYRPVGGLPPPEGRRDHPPHDHPPREAFAPANDPFAPPAFAPPRDHPPHHGQFAPPAPSIWMSPTRLLIAIACALLGVAAISFLFARSLARPLARLASTAQAFGSGDLTARAGIRRDDELGAVAKTFDQMADRVNALLRAQREFLANVSHELRTPLARIRVALDIAAEGDVETAKQCLREIAQDWGDLDRLVEDVLTVARFDLGQDKTPGALNLRYEPLDARTLAERAAAAFRGVHARHTLEVDAAPATLYADGAMLRRVVDNLLHNAAKYSEPGSTIRLSVVARAGQVEFSVADRGIGIDDKDLPRLFEPFFRSDKSRARKTGGVGLGLALAKRIVVAHHGEIAVESQVGVGTTVRFRVPVEPEAAVGGEA